MTVRREFELSEDDIAFIDRKAGDGAVDVNELVGRAIKMLRSEEEAIDRWVREEVLPTYERWKAGGEKSYPADEVFDRIQEHIRTRTASKTS